MNSLGVIALVAILFIFNYFALGINIYYFTGIVLALFLVGAIVINFLKKYIQKKKGIKGEENAFIFPDKLAKKMKSVDVGIQLESTVISTSFLIIGMIAFAIYTLFFYEAGTVLKIFILFNTLCGIGLLGSMVITNFQQLVSYRESTKFINQYAQSKENKENYNVNDTYY